MSDTRLHVLRDMLIEGREDLAMRLLQEIAAEAPKSSPLLRLVDVQRDVHMQTGTRIGLTIHVRHGAFVQQAEIIVGHQLNWRMPDIEGTSLQAAPGIRVIGDLPR